MKPHLADILNVFMFAGITIAVLIILILLMVIVRRVIALIIRLKQSYVVIELVPPAFRDKHPEANITLMRALHGLGLSRSWVHKFIGLNSLYSLEIVSTRREGIR